MTKEEILKELYIISGQNAVELISEFEMNSQYNVELIYKGIYKKGDDIIIEVIDKITECLFELIYNKSLNKLEVY